MYRRAALAAPANATAAASSSSSGAAMTAGASWKEWRKSAVLYMANALPASERRAIMDQWGDMTHKVIQEADAQLSTMRSVVNHAKAAEANALAEVERLK
jgi:hypothetical protein